MFCIDLSSHFPVLNKLCLQLVLWNVTGVWIGSCGVGSTLLLRCTAIWRSLTFNFVFPNFSVRLQTVFKPWYGYQHINYEWVNWTTTTYHYPSSLCLIWCTRNKKKFWFSCRLLHHWFWHLYLRFLSDFTKCGCSAAAPENLLLCESSVSFNTGNCQVGDWMTVVKMFLKLLMEATGLWLRNCFLESQLNVNKYLM